jgi:hypothetical protein
MNAEIDPEPLALHDMPAADGSFAIAALPLDTPGETVEQIRRAIREYRDASPGPDADEADPS